MSAKISDEQLLAAFRAGDAEAFASLHKRFRDPIYAFNLRST